MSRVYAVSGADVVETAAARTPTDAASSVDAVARAVLYEGYVLWPYRRSAMKNRRRWTFGGVYPRGWSAAGHPDDAWRMVTHALLAGGAAARIEVRVRFLQVVRRGLETAAAGGRRPVDELEVGGERWLAWEEASERELAIGPLGVGELLQGPIERTLAVAAGRDEQALPRTAAPEDAEGWVVRSWEALRGRVEIAARPVESPAAGDLHRLEIAIENLTPWAAGDREQAVQRAFVSTHTLITAAGAGFVSLADPPAALAGPAEACRSACRGTWPVLAGEPGDRSTLFSSPIILEDYPRIAPESPGDLFDGGEIDQLLILNVLAMTDEERREMAASDPKAREILERCTALAPEELWRLHGTFRDLRALRETGGGA